MEESARTFSSSLCFSAREKTCSKLAFEERGRNNPWNIARSLKQFRSAKFVTRTTISYYISSQRAGSKDKIYNSSFFHELGRYPAKGGEQRERARHCLFTFSLLFFEISPPLPPLLCCDIFSRIHEIFPSRCYFKPFFPPPHPFPSHLFAARSHRAKAHRWTKIRAEE